MKNFIKFSIIMLFLQGCGPTASIVSTGITIAQSGSTTRAVAASGSGFFVKQKTGKQPLEHVADNTINAELRKCNVSHSAEINEIFFTTLDEFDCEKNYLNQANLYYLR
tara:strand:- start:515 stop:841 length:327 start_codon:yes stop_codon:yes gene_type:complete